MKIWTKEDVAFLRDFYPKYGKSYCAKKLGRTESAAKTKAQKLGIKFKDYEQYKKTKEDYLLELAALGFELIDEFKGVRTKIWHRHRCGFEYQAMPTSIITDRARCPACSSKGFLEPHTLYFIKFEELNLYKLGITKNLSQRMKSFGYAPTVIKTWEFRNGNEARNKEQALLKGKLKDRLCNTGLLKTGNTETFKL